MTYPSCLRGRFDHSSLFLSFSLSSASVMSGHWARMAVAHMRTHASVMSMAMATFSSGFRFPTRLAFLSKGPVLRFKQRRLFFNLTCFFLPKTHEFRLFPFHYGTCDAIHSY